MEEAFEGADFVYPKSWAPFSVMEERTVIVETGRPGRSSQELERRCLENNARFKDWECTRELMANTDKALYMHCLPADITGVSCAQGEVAADVFDRFRTPLYRQAELEAVHHRGDEYTSRMGNPPGRTSPWRWTGRRPAPGRRRGTDTGKRIPTHRQLTAARSVLSC